MALPQTAQIVEVSARDGLQNEPRPVPLAVKIELIDHLSQTGLTHIESGAFVSPKWVPQMADTAEVFAGIKQKQGVVYSALVPNEQGMQAALAAGVKTVAVFIAASESFSKKNINATIEESLTRLAPVFALAQKNDVRVRGYISCVMGCPFEGAVAPQKTANLAKRLIDMGCYEISLGDTIGTGTPELTRALVAETARFVPVQKLAMHCHDTYGRAIDNIVAALEMGVAVIDSSVAGIGGCPYAKTEGGKRAPGNVATETVVQKLESLGVKTGLDLGKIREAGLFIRERLQ